ncbi:MAG: acyl-CoA dehydratase activase [Desulfovibrio sp.]
MKVGGIDIGSRSMELVVIDGGKVVLTRQLPTTFNPLLQCKNILKDVEIDTIVATGYGRDLVSKCTELPVTTITEIKAHALGAVKGFPESRTVLDIGGQDTKAISLTAKGRVDSFEMNDRCAAGTGKFLEYTAAVFQIPIEKFGPYALEGNEPPLINSMCTVFAETEATSLMAQGIAPENIALGLHNSIVRRTVNMLSRVGLQYPLVFTGGVAKNPCIVDLLCKELGAELGKELFVSDSPDMNGALGAALAY